MDRTYGDYGRKTCLPFASHEYVPNFNAVYTSEQIFQRIWSAGQQEVETDYAIIGSVYIHIFTLLHLFTDCALFSDIARVASRSLDTFQMRGLIKTIYQTTLSFNN